MAAAQEDTVSEVQKIFLGALISVVLGASTAYFTAKEQASVQVNRLEERQANQYNELRSMVMTVKEQGNENAQMIRDDLNGVRAEILNILRNRR